MSLKLRLTRRYHTMRGTLLDFIHQISLDDSTPFRGLNDHINPSKPVTLLSHFLFFYLVILAPID